MSLAGDRVDAKLSPAATTWSRQWGATPHFSVADNVRAGRCKLNLVSKDRRARSRRTASRRQGAYTRLVLCTMSTQRASCARSSPLPAATPFDAVRNRRRGRARTARTGQHSRSSRYRATLAISWTAQASAGQRHDRAYSERGTAAAPRSASRSPQLQHRPRLGARCRSSRRPGTRRPVRSTRPLRR